MEKNIEELLFRYFAGDLSEAEKEELLLWLQADESHKELFSGMSDWWATAHIPFFVSEKRLNFKKHFAHLTTQAPQNNGGRVMFRWNVAVSLLALMTMGIISFHAGKKFAIENAPAIEEVIEDTEIITLHGSITKVALPDGSYAWLNAGSSLKYTNTYNKESREVKLTGEVYFEVKSDTVRPFIVKSKDLAVKVTGTCFDVKAYDNEETVNVTLVSGSVHVHLNNHPTEEEPITLSPDRMLSYSKETKEVDVVTVDAKDAMGWINGNIKFVERPFPLLAKELERKFNIYIRIESKYLKNEVFSGSFLPGYSLDDVLYEMDVDRKYTWRKENNVLIIRDK